MSIRTNKFQLTQVLLLIVATASSCSGAEQSITETTEVQPIEETASPTETIIPSSSPTPEDLLHLLPIFETRVNDVSSISVEYSPYKDWQAVTYYDKRLTDEGTFIHMRLDIQGSYNGRKFTLFERVERFSPPFGHYPEIVGWSTATNQMYFIDSLGFDGCFGSAYQNLSVLNLVTGEIRVLVPNPARFALSPDARTLAYIPNQHDHLAIISLDEEVTTILLDDLIERDSKERSIWQFSDLIWSPNSTAFILTANENACDMYDNNATIRVDVPSMQVTILRDFEERTFSFLEWNEDGIVVLESGAVPFTYWIMNPNNGSLVPFDYPPPAE